MTVPGEVPPCKNDACDRGREACSASATYSAPALYCRRTGPAGTAFHPSGVEAHARKRVAAFSRIRPVPQLTFRSARTTPAQADRPARLAQSRRFWRRLSPRVLPRCAVPRSRPPAVVAAPSPATERCRRSLSKAIGSAPHGRRRRQRRGPCAYSLPPRQTPVARDCDLAPPSSVPGSRKARTQSQWTDCSRSARFHQMTSQAPFRPRRQNAEQRP